MLELSSIKAVDGAVHCEVKNMKMGDPKTGFTLYEGPIEMALTNIIKRTFFTTKSSIKAAAQAFRFMRTSGSIAKYANEIEEAFKVLENANPILVSEILKERALPVGLTALLYPHTTHEGLIKLLPVMSRPKPVLRSSSMVLYLENRTVIARKDDVLYYYKK